MPPLQLLVAGLAAAIALAAPARAANCLPSQAQVSPCAVSQPPCPVVELPCDV
ncbi:hypothetical protein [Synechococcus sp. CS-1332]|uniref:hypothetical protein n=1 Tax=Synechococcus sp. CS-1332 TaxID=2847972 RepID=UPI00223AA3DE|nr:hypothetical protein [Synechococcus sp. CS-1332]MCT0208444.1 hypothetical protein [Synechococcus sp. CS-1332]